jgi:hypothetical protein
MKLTDDIDSVYQFVKGSGLIFGYVFGYCLAIVLVLGLVFCSIMGHTKKWPGSTLTDPYKVDANGMLQPK